MAVSVLCPQCRFRYRVDEKRLGSSADCKKCGARFTLAVSADETVGPIGTPATERDARSQPAPRPATDCPWAPAICIGRYEIRERLGAGAFGAVYRAHDAVLARDVALKVPHAALLDSTEARERFLREARAAASLRHPNIVPVYDAGQQGEEVFIASAFIAGHTLAAELATGNIDWKRAAEITAKLADALQAAHEVGIVHRDVKPANVMLDQRSEPLLMDFGLAAWSEGTSKLTADHMLLGTPAYMSPEQASGNQAAVGPASDQYSLGVLLYELICRRVPFDGPPLAVLYQVREQPPPAPRSINAAIPTTLEAICLKAVSKRAQDRFADCRLLSQALRQVSSPPGTGPIRLSHLPGGVRILVPARWRMAAIAVAACLTLLLVGVLVIGLMRDGKTPDDNTAASTIASAEISGGKSVVRRIPPLDAGGSDDETTAAPEVPAAKQPVIADQTDQVPHDRDPSDTEADGVKEPDPSTEEEPALPPDEALPPAEDIAPVPAVAPFDGERARRHQQDWADHLGCQVVERNSIGVELVLVPPGRFLMGSPDEEAGRGNDEAQVSVTLTRPFQIGRTEVTQRQWYTVMETRPWSGEELVKPDDSSPATNFDWDDAVEFCGKLTERERDASVLPIGWTYALPSEAQWEYACRAGTTSRFSFGDDPRGLAEFARIEDNHAAGNLLSVGQKLPNRFGLCDMHGNVEEWCWDNYLTPLPGGNDPLGIDSSGSKTAMVRGGSWGSDAQSCRSAIRKGFSYRNVASIFRGMRLVRLPREE